MKKAKIIPGVIALSLVLLFSCSDEFLNRPAQGNLDAVTLANQSGVEGNLIAAYALLDGGMNSSAGNWVLGSIVTDDAHKGSDATDIPAQLNLELYQWDTGLADGIFNGAWSDKYDAISRCNATLNLLYTVEGISQDDQDRIKGEALFLRAYYHLELYKYFGNVPYYTEEDTDYRKSNVGVDVLGLILADLNDAIDLLPTTQANIGRVTQWTAKALKGKVQVYQEDWGGANTTLSDVVDNGPYDLEANYHDVFDVDHNNGPETVLAFNASVNDGSSGGQNGMSSERLNFPHSGSPFGCCGFHQPTQNMVNAFKVDANGLPFLDGSWNDTELDPATDAVDPRVDWTAGRDGVPFLDWGIHEAGWIRDRAWAGPFSPKKNIYTQASGAGSSVGWAAYQMSSLNRHILRYGDVLLLLAEAKINVGGATNLEDARLLINEVRTRAAQGAQGPDGGDVVVPIDDASITWATYSVGTYPAAGWDAIAMDALMMERRLELGMEGHRMFDLRRWGTMVEVLNDYLAVEKTRRNFLTGAVPVTEKYNLYPLPSQQIELSTIDGEDRLVQNTGW